MSIHSPDLDAATLRRLKSWLDASAVDDRLPMLTEGEARAVVELLEQFNTRRDGDALVDIAQVLVIRILDRLPT